MKVTVSCAGRFHAYDMSAQFQRMGILHHLITSYPKQMVTRFGINNNNVTSLILWEMINRGVSKWKSFSGMNGCQFQPMINDLFDMMAVRHLSPETNIYIGWSSKSERGLIKAKSIGAKTILERGSSHILYQTEILTEEFRRYSMEPKKCFTHPKVIEKEIREYEMADYISVPSEFARLSFIEKGFPDSKIIKNPYGVNLSQFKPGYKKDDVFRVIFVGQMSLRKGVHYLLEAFDKLKLHKAELILVGARTPEIEPYFEKYKNTYTYLGVKPQSELMHYYQQSTVFVICSIEEGLAMVQFQAMASGLPLICTVNSGGEDLIEHGREGFVVPIRSVEAVCEKIQWMYDHQNEAREMGVRARNKVALGFSWQDYGNRYLDFLNTIHVPKA